MNKEMLSCFPLALQKELADALPESAREIRLYAGRRCAVCEGGVPWVSEYIISRTELLRTAQALCGYTLHMRKDNESESYITLRGGHRMGLCGRVWTRDGRTHVTDISSVCIRMAREVKGCAAGICDLLDGSFMILGAPGTGKTTLLRDAVRLVSDAGTAVGLCDERGEVAACFEGEAQMDVGKMTDVLTGCPRAQGLLWLIRSMSPQFVATDELGGQKDINAVRDAASRGVRVLAAMHGTKMPRELNDLFAHAVVLRDVGRIERVK